ncbi:MAG: TonB family protein [Kiritimatiellae bacterium]|nr:TonB family protein [Kiritimatiellia bacterium]
MSRYYKKSLTISSVVHGILILLFILVPLILHWCERRKPREIVTYIDLQAAALPEIAQPVEKIEIPEPEPEQPVPEPEIKEKIPLQKPTAKPTAKPTPKPKATAKPTAKPTPRPTPTPRKKIQVNKTRVKRTDEKTEKTPPRPRLTRDDIAKALGGAVASSASGQRVDDGIPSWYYREVQQAMFDRWQQPSDLAAAAGRVTRVSIRVMKNGTITRRELVSSSGVPLMDSSVMTAIESVPRLSPLPGTFLGDSKDIIIDFQLTGSL